MSIEGERALQHEKHVYEEKSEQERREHEKRTQSLDAAVRTHSAQGHQVTGPSFTADDVIASARKYYDFLKGT